MAMAGDPGFHRLVAYDLGVLVPAPGERHDEDPGLEYLARLPVGDHRTRTEVHLRHLGHRELQDDGRRWRRRCFVPEKPIQGMGTALKAVLAHERRGHG